MEMLDDGRSYTEVAQQISAVKAALDSALVVIIDDLVEDCATRAGKKDAELNQNLLEIRQVVSRIG